MTPRSPVSPGGRALAAVLEPMVASVYFAKESHEAMAALGYNPTPGQPPDGWPREHWGTVLLPDFHAYLSSRASLLGDVSGEVVAATFGVFSPSLIVPAVAEAHRIADVAAVRAARDKSAVAQLRRILGDHPDGLQRVNDLLERAGSRLQVAGKPIYAAVVGLGLPDDPMLRMWRLAERLREYRGDAFVAAFTSQGFDGSEIQMLTERLAGDPPRSYSRTRGYTEQELDDTEQRLTERGFLADERATEAGAQAREDVELTVDRMYAPVVDALGRDLPELVGTLQRWGDEVRTQDGYYWSGPPEEIVHPAVQDWLDDHGLRRLGGQPAGAH